MKIMKKSILTAALTTLMAVFTFVACHSTKEEKLEDAQENLQDAKQDLKEANNADPNAASNNATADEWKAYKRDIELRIDQNNGRIQELKMKVKKPGQVLDNMREKKIKDLEDRNARLRAKLDDYKNDHSDWAVFKAEVDKEVDDLQKDLDDALK